MRLRPGWAGSTVGNAALECIDTINADLHVLPGELANGADAFFRHKFLHDFLGWRRLYGT